MGQLLNAHVIDDDVVSELENTEVNGRGAVVAEHIIARNNLDIYEKFLEIWLGIEQSAAAAREFVTKLDDALRG